MHAGKQNGVLLIVLNPKLRKKRQEDKIRNDVIIRDCHHSSTLILVWPELTFNNFFFFRWPSCVDKHVKWWHKGKRRGSCQPTVFSSRWTSNNFYLGKRSQGHRRFLRNRKATSQLFSGRNSERSETFWEIRLSHPGSIRKYYSHNLDTKRYR